jgi:hypothetical protein
MPCGHKEFFQDSACGFGLRDQSQYPIGGQHDDAEHQMA